MDCHNGMVVPIFKKGDLRVCSNYWGITLPSLLGKAYARYWKGGPGQLSDLRFRRNNADSVLARASNSHQDFQQALGWFAAECEAVRMRVSTSKSEAVVLCWKTVVCPVRVGRESLPHSRGP